MEISFKDKKALVGGSSRGLGKAIAVQLAKAGASVCLMARNEDKLRKVISELDTSQGQKHRYLVADFSDLEAFKKIISAFFKENAVDILVNNTNGPSAGTVFDKQASDYQSAFDLLFQTVQYTTMLAIEHMQKQQFGRIINVTSVSVTEPLQNLVLSNTIRTALVSWAKTLSKELAKDNITVNNILTGYFDTERLDEINRKVAGEKGVDLDQLKKQMQMQVPMQRFGKPEEYGYLVAFLASEYASYITGSNIPIDGGLLKAI
ncbi:SDR family oxidoreductase [Leptobacterium flavescens]|uniref:SDR family oxidoreductase n=1 Tax=Leptobacterium flavescens TaxID=472055 RepID=A0A6P0UM63_9FLAO|nr:SDR family oxidoreductase [Leptobacterium flavescens]NER13662.1 SDR family oxidoreductase [Leptobacterium flavescens]